MVGMNRKEEEDLIWEARHIEWPLPSTLSSNHLEASTLHALKKSISTQSSSYFKFVNKLLISNHGGSGGPSGPNSGSEAAGDKTTMMGPEQTFFHALKRERGISLKSPRIHCTAAANGTILSLLECITTKNGSSTNGTNKVLFYLVSRWNVRRDLHSLTILQTTAKIVHVFLDPITGTHAFFSARNGDFYYLHQQSNVPIKLMGFNDAAHYKAGKPYDALILPPNNSTTASSNNSTLLYPDPSLAQIGLTPNSYVTSMAWSHNPSNTTTTTSSSSNIATTNINLLEPQLQSSSSHPYDTNTILLGTSLGEIYEYTLDQGIILQSLESSSSSSVHGTGGGMGGEFSAGPASVSHNTVLSSSSSITSHTSTTHYPTYYSTSSSASSSSSLEKLPICHTLLVQRQGSWLSSSICSLPTMSSHTS